MEPVAVDMGEKQGGIQRQEHKPAGQPSGPGALVLASTWGSLFACKQCCG